MGYWLEACLQYPVVCLHYQYDTIVTGVVHRGRPPFKRILKKRGSVEKADFALLEEVSDEAGENKANKKKGTPNSFRPPLHRHAKHSNPN